MSVMDTAVATDQAQYLTFRLAGDEYAIDILRVREIIGWVPPTRVPGMPAQVLGVINLRGRVVPVVDLGLQFGLGGTAVTKRSCAIIVEAAVRGETTVVGVLAEQVSQVVSLAEADVEPAPAFGARVRAELLRGLGKVGGAFLLLLDVDRVLAESEMLVAAAAAPRADDVGD